MKSAAEVIARLRERDLYEPCESVARQCGVPLQEIFSDTKQADVVDARHEVWIAVYRELDNLSATARIFGVDHSTVHNAVRKSRAFVRVELASFSQEFEVDGDVRRYSCRFEWVSRKGKPFAVIDSFTETTEWFETYTAAEACYLRWCARARSMAQTLGASPNAASAAGAR